MMKMNVVSGVANTFGRITRSTSQPALPQSVENGGSGDNSQPNASVIYTVHPNESNEGTNMPNNSQRPQEDARMVSSNVLGRRKSFVKQRIDFALVTANASQLNTLKTMKGDVENFTFLMVFLILSISLQVIYAVCSILLWKLEKLCDKQQQQQRENKEYKQLRIYASRLDMFGTIIVLFIIFSNIMVASFGSN